MNAVIGYSLLALAGEKTFPEGLAYQAVGIMIVLVSLGAISLILVGLGKISLPASAVRSKSAAAPVSTPSAIQELSTSEISPEIRAAIAAAIFATETGAFRIVEIRAATDVRLQAWSVEGRRQIFHSHQLR